MIIVGIQYGQLNAHLNGTVLAIFQKKRHTASIFDSSQSIILANDCYCIYVLGRRPSKDHREAIKMHVEASSSKRSKKEILTEALEMRSKYGYTQVDTNPKDTQLLLIRAKRFLDWVKASMAD